MSAKSSGSERAARDNTVERGYLDEEIKALRRQLGVLENELSRIPTLESQVAEFERINEQLLQLTSDLEKRQADHEELVRIAERYTVVVGSTSWKLTRPLRHAMAFLRKRPS
jgi:O-antigen chain-terminating methyltransferase